MDYSESAHINTHPRGYKFKLKLYSNFGASKYLAVDVYSIRGDHDDKLKFPAKFTITLELLNQHRDQDHYSKELECTLTREKVASFERICRLHKFISHADLQWNPSKRTQYLKNDCLKFRLTRIKLL